MVTYPDETWDPVTKMNHALYDGTLLRIFDDRFSAILCNTQMEMVRAGGGARGGHHLAMFLMRQPPSGGEVKSIAGKMGEMVENLGYCDVWWGEGRDVGDLVGKSRDGRGWAVMRGRVPCHNVPRYAHCRPYYYLELSLTFGPRPGRLR